MARWRSWGSQSLPHLVYSSASVVVLLLGRFSRAAASLAGRTSQAPSQNRCGGILPTVCSMDKSNAHRRLLVFMTAPC